MRGNRPCYLDVLWNRDADQMNEKSLHDTTVSKWCVCQKEKLEIREVLANCKYFSWDSWRKHYLEYVEHKGRLFFRSTMNFFVAYHFWQLTPNVWEKRSPKPDSPIVYELMGNVCLFNSFDSITPTKPSNDWCKLANSEIPMKNVRYRPSNYSCFLGSTGRSLVICKMALFLRRLLSDVLTSTGDPSWDGAYQWQKSFILPLTTTFFSLTKGQAIWSLKPTQEDENYGHL